jgi:SAM-dependent methyltransferase
MAMPPPDWKLPHGVSRGLWHYLHDDTIAQGYDANLGGASLIVVDHSFVLEHCQPPGWLIDMGCGTGRLLVPLVQRGYRVLGVDLSAPMLRIAGEKAALAGVRIERAQANLVDLGCFDDACFDFAICLFNTLGWWMAQTRAGRWWSMSTACCAGAVFLCCTSTIAASTSGIGWAGAGCCVICCSDWGDATAPATALCLIMAIRRP